MESVINLYICNAVVHVSEINMMAFFITLNFFDKKRERSYEVKFFTGRVTRCIMKKYIVTDVCDKVNV